MISVRKRFLAGFLAFNLVFGGTHAVSSKVYASGPETSISQSAPSGGGGVTKSLFISVLGSVLAAMCPRILGELIYRGERWVTAIKKKHEVSKYSGFRDTPTVVNNLEKICNNKSDIRVYGQDKAKKQMFDALSGVIARIDDMKRGKYDPKDMRGNIVYLIGPSGTGKTKMCYAIADAFLKYSEKSSIFCHSESITNEAELGTQLFKTVLTKDIGENRQRNWLTGSDGLVPKDEESAMLKHLLQWHESVVIIDEYDKMKKKSAKPGTTMNYLGMNIPATPGQSAPTSDVDNSADEILRSIASTGKYKVMNKEVDCSKTLFLVTTNETKEELEANFGIGGTKGGGAQRLNIIEFDYLSEGACRGIVDDMLENMTKSLTDPEGPYRLGEVVFEEESRKFMTEYVLNDKVAQGRAKNKLEDGIRGLMSKSMGKDYGKKIRINFKQGENAEELLFSKEEIV